MKDAVLLLGFNRPALLARVIDHVRAAEPPRVYLAVDGARVGRAGEQEAVRATQALASSLDWGCSVQTLFQPENLGCGRGVSTAVTWFFDHEQRGIILEDDLLPRSTFFPYCEELLDRYETDERVFAVSGCNYVPEEFITHPEDAYRFSRIPHIWGWATWRRSWSRYDWNIAGWRDRLPPNRLYESSGRSILGTAYWWSTFELMARHHVDTWDAQLVFAAMANRGLTATPNVNLVENIGFGADATHTVRQPDHLLGTTEVLLPMSPVDVVVDERADAWTRKHHFRATIPGFAVQGARYLRRRLGSST